MNADELASADKLDTANVRIISVRPIRPTGMEIIETLARNFNVSEKTALQWIYDFDGSGMSRLISDRE